MRVYLKIHEEKTDTQRKARGKKVLLPLRYQKEQIVFIYKIVVFHLQGNFHVCYIRLLHIKISVRIGNDSLQSAI
jgi:hypothetical protein